MKKFTILSLFAAFVLFGLSANAQEQGDIRAGAGLAYGTKAGVDASGTKGAIGINLGAEYLFTDAISLAPSYTFFFKSSVGGADYNVSSFNIDARYYFGDSGFYGLAGLGIVSNKVSGGGFSVSGSETGINLGAGYMYGLSDSMFLNGQAKYNTADFGDGGQITIQAGLAFAF